jgi:hypothetical protein
MPYPWNIIWDLFLTVAPYLSVALFTIVCLIVYKLSKQRKLLKFFGADNISRRIIVYLSSLLIPRGNAYGFDGQQRSYQGITVPIEEFSYSTPITKEFSLDPFDSVIPFIRNPLKKKYAFFRNTQIDVNASPMKEMDIDFSSCSIITIGSQGYNIVSNYCTSHNLSQIVISNNGTEIQIVKGKYKGELISPPSARHDIAILEKLIDKSRKCTTIFVCAGLSTIGTMGSIQYLIDHWQELYKKYKKDEFALILQFGPIGEMSQEELLRGNIVRQLPE